VVVMSLTLGTPTGCADRGGRGDPARAGTEPRERSRPYSADMPWARRVSVGVALLAALHVVAAVVLFAGDPTIRTGTTLAIALTVVPLATGLSILVAWRPDGGVVGTLLGLLSLAVAHVVAKEIWLQWLATTGDPEDWAWLVALTAEDAWWIIGIFGLLLLYFPDGRLPSRRWVWVPPALVTCVVATQIYGAFEEAPFRAPLQDLARPFGEPPLIVDVLGALFFVMLPLFLACTVSLVLRFRRSERVQRQQIKWLALAGIGLPLYPVLCLLEILIWGEELWFSAAVGVAALVATPVAAAVAVLRHDLYDVDKALALAVTWGVLTALLLGVYAVASSIVGVAVGRDSQVGVAVGTAAAALLLLPGLRAVRRHVDARMYPLRRGALTAVDALHHDVSAGTARPEQLQATLREALRDPGLRVGYRLPGSASYLDADGVDVPDQGVPVLLDEEQTGVLVRAVGPSSPELLREVADRCTTLVEVVRLRSEVATALREAESSRSRLVEIGYEERRRMERDLHDGAQQRLVSLGMQLRLAQRHLGDGSVDVDELLDQSVAELGSAVSELRQIAHGLRPSSLDDGLPAALSNLVRSVPLTVDMDVDDSPLPDVVATTAYYVASEAITNAVKHAEATRIVLQVVRRDGQLLVRVTDDGCGGARLGLRSGLRDRVAALGGSLHVASPHGHGTEVEAALPFDTLAPLAAQEPPCAS
jgi:signal transduction histidine kinase